MKVYQLRLILGRATNYDQTGKLKNQTITAKYAGEMELEMILADRNWQKLGACEISCVGVFDTETKAQDTEMMAAINNRIKSDIQAGTKPKTEIELLKEQIAALTEKVNSPVIPIPFQETESFKNGIESWSNNPDIKPAFKKLEKERRESLFTEAKELGLTPAKNVKTDILKDLVTNAKK